MDNTRFAENLSSNVTGTTENSSHGLPSPGISVSTPSEKEEILKILKRPRSKKYMKALKMADHLSKEDEMLIAEIRKEKGLGPNDPYTVTDDDLEAFHRKVCEAIQEEERREREARIDLVKSGKLVPIDRLSTCGLPDCKVHNFRNGDIYEHFNMQEIEGFDDLRKRAANIILSREDWNAVEIYEDYLVQRNSSGDTIMIYEV